jgi:hypothetical protein
MNEGLGIQDATGVSFVETVLKRMIDQLIKVIVGITDHIHDTS